MLLIENFIYVWILLGIHLHSYDPFIFPNWNFTIYPLSILIKKIKGGTIMKPRWKLVWYIKSCLIAELWSLTFSYFYYWNLVLTAQSPFLLFRKQSFKLLLKFSMKPCCACPNIILFDIGHYRVMALYQILL